MPAPASPPPTESEPIVQLRGVSKRFESRRRTVVAVDDVDLEVGAGEVFGVVGYSGAGKSTLLRLINALERPTSGQVLVEGVDVTALRGRELRELRRRIGMIFQQFNLMESRTVAYNVGFPLTLTRTPRTEIRRRVAEVLEFVGLADKASAYPSQLSGGQKQRVGIARALAAHPDILICDEATSALDPQTTDEVLTLLTRANRDYGLTIVLITHEMEVVKKICTRVAVMQDGRIVEQGDTYRVFSAPESEASTRFVRSAVRDRPSPALLDRVRREASGTLVEVPLDSASGDALSVALRTAGVDFVFHFGGLDEVRERTFGRVLLELRGTPDAIAGVIADLGLREVPRGD
ncbi:MAG: ATP-binding cassette domain-containing protein [Protaetiibacter sp.]